MFPFLYHRPVSFVSQVKNLFGSSLVAFWPLSEIIGTVVHDVSGNAHHGSYEGSPSLAAVSGVRGHAPQLDGVDDCVDLFSAGLAAAFNCDEGSIIIQWRIEETEWLDGKSTYYICFRADDNNRIQCYKAGGSHQLAFAYKAGGTSTGLTLNDMCTEKFLTYALTWSKSNDRVMGYVNGSKYIRTPLTGLGVFTGSLTSAEVGGRLGNAAYFAKCAYSSVILLNREATAAEMKKLAVIYGSNKVLSVLGDSISSTDSCSQWSRQLTYEYGGGNKLILIDHAVGGNSIMAHMATQTLEAAGDDANIIIIQLGPNDSNGGDMEALQAEVEENVAALKLSNPRAVIYYLNVLPLWTDETGTTEKSMGNMRAAIAAACTSQGITCWDTYTDPWRTAAQTSDGVHSNQAGNLAIAAEVLARL